MPWFDNPLREGPWMRLTVAFLVAFTVIYQLSYWHPNAKHTERNELLFKVDLICSMVAGEKAALGQDPYGIRPGTLYAPYSAGAWQRYGLAPGEPVYAYLYPPPVALLARHLPVNTLSAWRIYIYLNLAAVASLLLILFSARADGALRMGVLLYLLTTVASPFITSLHNGQVNVAVAWAFFYAAFLLGLKARWARALGYLLGAAGFWIKLMPVAFSGLSALARRRSLLWLGAAILGLGGLTYLADPAFFGHWLRHATGFNALATQADARRYAFGADTLTNGLLLGRPPATAAALLLKAAIVGLIAAPAYALYRRGQPGSLQMMLLPVAAGIFLVAPLSWDHHMAFYAGPALVGLAATFRAWQGRGAAVALTILTAGWMVCPRLYIQAQSLYALLAYCLTPLLVCALLAAFAWGCLSPRTNRLPIPQP